MALRSYCESCGAATEYTLKIPLRCCMCGELFDKKSVSSVKSVQTNNKPFIQTPARIIGEKRYLEDEDGKYEEILEVPKIDKLDVSIDLRGSQKKFTLGELRPDLAKKMSKNPIKKGRKSKK